MRLFLDENITPRAFSLFQALGYDVNSVHEIGKFGMSDEEVFSIAQSEQRVLITHNGKDFIIQIPPRMLGVHHEGLLWLKFMLNRTNLSQACDEIHAFFEKLRTIANSIWIYNGSSSFTRIYPEE